MGQFFEFPYELINKDEKIILVGAGSVGQSFIDQVEKTKYCEILAVSDRVKKGIVSGYEIIEHSKITEYNYDKLLVSVASGNQGTVLEDLKELGLIDNRCVYSDYISYTPGYIETRKWEPVDKLTFLTSIIKEASLNNAKKIIIYPYGKEAKHLAKFLEETTTIFINLVVESVSDNQLLSQLMEENWEDSYFVLCAFDKVTAYNVLKKVNNIVPKDRIIDIFMLYMEKELIYDKLRFGEPRSMMLESCSREIILRNIPGCCAEAGVYQGDFSALINECLPDRKLFLFDTFEGFDIRDVEFDRSKGLNESYQDFSDTSIQLVLNKMAAKENVIVRKGYFPETAEGIEEKFCFVSLDMDLYKPIADGLEYFYPRLSHGGYIFVHDCRCKGYNGSRKAVMEFAEKNNISYVCLCDDYGTVIITK